MQSVGDAALEFDLFGPVDDTPLAFTPHSIWYLENG